MKWYVGYKNGFNFDVCVHINDRNYKLNPCYELVNHSPDGFAWGYNGSGPAQLALAICVDVTQDENKAMKVYQKFKEQVIASLNMSEGFRISEKEVEKHINEIHNS